MEEDQCQSNTAVDLTTYETILAMNTLTLTPLEENLGLTPDYDSSVSPDGYLPPTPPGSPPSQVQTATILRRRFDTEFVLKDFPPLRCPAKAERIPRPSCLRVLLVDDNHVNLRILERLLNKHLSHIIHQVRVAQDASQALALLCTNDFDMVMMDIEMPGMSGVEATTRIRAGEAGERHRTIPIVAVTTKFSPYWRSLYLENGMVVIFGYLDVTLFKNKLINEIPCFKIF
jgi:CheY-like chemotaxis protein